MKVPRFTAYVRRGPGEVLRFSVADLRDQTDGVELHASS
jgi:hypothetical protein